MKILSSRLFWGFLLLIGGILFLLDTTGIFRGSDLFWAILMAIVGVLFLSVYFTNHLHWWALIPGVIFLTLAANIALDRFLPGFNANRLGGTILLGGIALSFLLVYLVERSNWWAIIPFGVMATIATVALVDVNASGATSGGVFFLGLGLTFALVAILPTSVGRMRWAWIPALVLGVIGILILISARELINYVWPVILIAAGLFFIIKSIVNK